MYSVWDGSPLPQQILMRSPQSVHSFSIFLKIADLKILVKMQADTDGLILWQLNGVVCISVKPIPTILIYTYVCAFVFLHNDCIVCSETVCLSGLALVV